MAKSIPSACLAWYSEQKKERIRGALIKECGSPVWERKKYELIWSLSHVFASQHPRHSSRNKNTNLRDDSDFIFKIMSSIKSIVVVMKLFHMFKAHLLLLWYTGVDSQSLLQRCAAYWGSNLGSMHLQTRIFTIWATWEPLILKSCYSNKIKVL